MNHIIRQMPIDDYDEVYRLWEQTEGLTLEEALRMLRAGILAFKA